MPTTPKVQGTLERMHRTLKETLTELIPETGENRVGILPLAPLGVRCIPYVRGIPPFEILFGRPPPLLPKLGDEQWAEISNQHLGFIPRSRFTREPISPILVPLFVGLGGSQDPLA